MCHGDVSYYKIETQDCFFSFTDIVVTNGSLINPSPFSNSFGVIWSNTGNIGKTGRLEASYTYYSGGCPVPGSNAQLKEKLLTKDVGIAPNLINVPHPGIISSALVYSQSQLTNLANSYYVFTLPEREDISIQWQIVSGGIEISRTNFGLKVHPIDGACNIIVRARGYQKSCSGTTSYSNWSTKTTSIPIPANPGQINGSNKVISGITETYTIGNVNNAAEYLWRINGGSSWRILPSTTINGNEGIIPNGNTIKVSYTGSFGSTATLYIKAVNSCGESIAESQKLVHGLSPISINRREGKEMIVNNDIYYTTTFAYPNPLIQGEPLNINLKDNDVNRVVIKSLDGKMIYSSEIYLGIKTEITENLKRGIYNIELYQSDKLLSSEKLIVQ